MSEEVIKKSISLRGDIYDYALEKSEKLHGGNFSAYVTYLISCEKNQTSEMKNNFTLTKEEIELLLKSGNSILFLLDIIDKSVIRNDKNNLSIPIETIKELFKLMVNPDLDMDESYDISIRY